MVGSQHSRFNTGKLWTNGLIPVRVLMLLATLFLLMTVAGPQATAKSAASDSITILV